MKHPLQQLKITVAAFFFTLSCGATGFATAEPLNVVASFSILGDMTSQIGGDRIEIHTLVGRDADAHVYQPTPADAKKLAQAQLVVVNGFGFEGWIDRLVKSSGYRGRIVTASAGVKALGRPHGDERQRAHAHDGDADPHAWQDLANALQYADNIAAALAAADPAGKAIYMENAEQYKIEIRALDAAIRRSFSTIPAAGRKVVTTHDAFAYFGRAYGLAFIAPVGINTEAEPSAADIGRIIRQIRSEKIPAVFMESISDPRLLERIRQESGAAIGGTLYADSLSQDKGPAPTYLEMMRYNAKTLTTALTN